MGLAGLERGRENWPMDVDRELARFDPLAPIEQAWTPPSSWYTDPDFHQRELREVFARTWQPVAAQNSGTGGTDDGSRRAPRGGWRDVPSY